MEKTLFGLTIDEMQGEKKVEYLANSGISKESESLYKVFCISAVDNYGEYCFSLVDEESGCEQIIQNWDENTVCIVELDDANKVLSVAGRRRGIVDRGDGRDFKVCKIMLGD